MKIAIVDDEIVDCEKLSAFIERYSDENCVECSVSVFTQGKTFLMENSLSGFDVVFMDIFLKNENGMEIAEKMRLMGDNSLIVFATTTGDYAVRSFRVRAFDYIVKPYNYSQFSEIFKLCVNKMSRNVRYFTVKSKRQNVHIFFNDVVYIDYYNHYVQIHTINGVISTYSSFDDFYANIENENQFLLCCRNCAINMDAVKKFSGKNFTMSSGDVLALGKRQEKEARNIYANYTFLKLEKAR